MQENDLPAEAIVDKKIFTDMNQLHGLLLRLRRHDPLPWVQPEGYDPFWLATRHADIVAIEQDPETFINEPRQAIFSIAYQQEFLKKTGGVPVSKLMRNLVAMDGEEHKAFRAMTQSQFMSKALVSLRSDVEALAKEFVGRMASKGGACDFSADIAMWYPLRVIMSILGVPPKDEANMLRLTQRILSSEDPEFQSQSADETSANAIMELAQYFMPVIADRRANPQGDIASVIANATYEGKPIEDRDAFGYFLIVATAGHDTTSYALAGGMHALLNNPAQLQKLRDNPQLAQQAAEEMIRWTAPVRHFCRTATKDIEIAGKLIKAGDAVLLSYPSASRDDAAFEDPFTFNIERTPNRHLAFGTGPHVCLGQHLARMELACFLTEFVKRVDHIKQTGDARYVEATFVGGVKSLPVEYSLREEAA